ncbi:MAG: LCP family protein [Christensenellales bacterium]
MKRVFITAACLLIVLAGAFLLLRQVGLKPAGVEPSLAPGQSAQPSLVPGQTARPTAVPGQSVEPSQAPGQSAQPSLAPGQTEKPITVPIQDGDLLLTEEQIAAISAALDDESKALPVDEQFRVSVSENDLSITEGLNADWLNILLLGTDTGSIQLNNGRTDAMLVLSLHKKTGQMKMTSLIRDMLVTIPGYKIQNRINTANAFGGPLLAIKTVNQVLGLNIDRYCSINFAGLRDMVDYLGGVTLTLSSGEATIVGAPHKTEPQLLNGEQALAYVRIRKLDNNFGRNERQREFLTAVLDQVKQNSMDQIIDAVTAGFKTIATNLTTNEVIALLPAVIGSTDALQMMSLPQEGSYKFAQTKAGASVIEFKADEVKSAFHAFVYGQ